MKRLALWLAKRRHRRDAERYMRLATQYAELHREALQLGDVGKAVAPQYLRLVRENLDAALRIGEDWVKLRERSS